MACEKFNQMIRVIFLKVIKRYIWVQGFTTSLPFLPFQFKNDLLVISHYLYHFFCFVTFYETTFWFNFFFNSRGIFFWLTCIWFMFSFVFYLEWLNLNVSITKKQLFFTVLNLSFDLWDYNFFTLIKFCLV